MALIRSNSLRFVVILICLIFGTWVGVLLQQFAATATLFKNIVDFTIDINKVDLMMIKFGFLFSVKLNLGTVIGGAIGIWVAR
ncbi:MAG: hypothetical protein GXZ13_04730 [Synergistaceae bacterium]|jgi:hypothetical protein|nr:hypothetical protein [Synergistaceae bacterium]